MKRELTTLTEDAANDIVDATVLLTVLDEISNQLQTLSNRLDALEDK
ncbi:MAG: hypothetical protein Unbinned1446contig1005_44 [Prokaryotic dsDNA virus sp.]|nr:MAG: hypothetical protein Unbinned1446contig1005_44 [Prokaryotic dsDNA virus sp.]|tara:strand:+ start:3923 stop:4063 length:141 start_codon:yes stop_codon:yes gene_type:complete